MSSSVCQGLQSCLEPRLVESRFLRLKLAPLIPNFSGSIAPPNPAAPAPAPAPAPHPKPLPYNQPINTNNNNNPNDCKLAGGDNQSMDMGGWSFLHSLANANANAKVSAHNDKVYVHPLVKRSASMLSEKSLEMCTESLGSETGSEVSESSASDDISLLPLETLKQVCSNPSKPKETSLVTRKMSRSSSFPPPLTSISGSNGVQVRSHREGGRLVLQAVSIPPCHSYFHAERSDGRLRLSLLKDATLSFDDDGDSQEEEQEEEIVAEEDDNDDDDEHSEVVYEDNGEVEDMEGNSGSVGGEIGTSGKLGRPSSCKESGRGHKGLRNWEPCWVAT